MPRICLVTPAHLGSNPRIVKEAHTLSAAGFETHVIFADTFPAARERDAAILNNANWSHEVVRQKMPARRIAAARRKMALAAFRFGISFVSVCESAHHSMVRALTRSACRSKADLYIGHCLAALPAVVKAAQINGALAGFDAEDYHSGESLEKGQGRTHNAIARKIEERYLPYVDHFTAASPLIATAYEKRFGTLPTTLLNVFPLSEAPAKPTQANAKDAVPSLYWFSQTIGPGRGLEEILEIAKQMNRPLRFDFRGHCRPDYERQLRQLVSDCEIELRVLPPENPDRMVSLAAGYTGGLALERTEPLNRDLCLTNKAFTYLLAGTPVILSRTSAQERLAGELGSAAILLDISNRKASALALNQWLDQRRFVDASKAAWKLGQEKYNWDTESKLLLSAVENVFNTTATGTSTKAKNA